MRQVVALLLLLAVIAIPFNAFAHSGGTNSSGCHSGTEPYHCHDEGDSGETMLLVGGIVLLVALVGVVIWATWPDNSNNISSTPPLIDDDSLAMPQLDVLVTPEGDGGGVTARWAW